LIEQSWFEEVDTSTLLGVVPIVAVSSKGPILVEFIALERRERGAVLALRIIDDEATDEAPNFVVPRIAVLSSNNQEVECQVIANDFVSLGSVRHRAVMRPELVPGSRVSFIIEGFEFDDRNVGAHGPWASPDVEIDD
jgi:hypothetical protein